MYRAGIIGCGGRGRAHAQGYQLSPDVEIVACSDPVGDSRSSFVKQFGIDRSYDDYQKMLDEEDLDFVSVCTWIRLHKDMIVNAANSGIKAIHAEKPIAPTWGEARELYQACLDNDVLITFCHQRRFGAPFVKAKQLAHDGTIGELVRVEGNCPNMLDWGTHWFDMFFFYNNDQPAEWVIGQVDGSSTKEVFGVPVAAGGISWIRWKSGLEGFLATGSTGLQGAANRLVGTHGKIEVHADGVPIRVMSSKSNDWQFPNLSGVVPTIGDDTSLSVLNLIDAVKTGQEPELSGRKAMQATELIFATYQSSRIRRKVVLPLNIDDSPLLSMIETGEIAV